MNFHLFDLVGLIGVLLILITYLLLQLDKLPNSSPKYSLLNAAGALLIILSLVFAFNLSAFIVEAFWLLISLVGFWRSLRSRTRSKLASDRNNRSQENNARQHTSG
jgi:predicted membrane protein